MKLSTITVATGNRHKIQEIRSLFQPMGVDIRGLPPGVELPAETGEDFRTNALLKARYGFALTGVPTLADDSGLEVRALGGAPGVRSARYAGEDADGAANNNKLVQALAAVDDRHACFRCVMVLATEDGEIEAEGICQGLILDSPRGRGGFGYDPLFLLPGLGKTTAEISEAEKNAVSHRGRAAANLIAVLRTRGLL